MAAFRIATPVVLLVMALAVVLEAVKTHEAGAATSNFTGLEGMMACTCSCCEVSPRIASLRSSATDAETQCAPLITETAGCHAECEDVDLANAAADSTADSVTSETAGLTDYSRFCLSNCVPSAEMKKGIRVACTHSTDPSLSGEAAVARAMAKAYSPQLLREGVQQASASKSESSPLEETGALVADAEGKKAIAMAIEAKAAASEASAAAARARSTYDLQVAQSRGSLAEEVKAQLRESAKRAEVFAKSAKDAAKKAMDELQEMQDVPKVAAQEAAQAAVDQLKKQDKMNYQVMGVLDATVNPPPVPPPPVAAGKAAEPYGLAMGRAAEMQSTYENKASQLTYEADLLRTGAKQVEGQMKAYEDAGRHDLANEVKARSDDLLVRSMAKDTEAAETLHQAQQIEQDIPKYASAAATAVARATILGNQKWMPPPVALGAAGSPAPAGLSPAPAADLAD